MFNGENISDKIMNNARRRNFRPRNQKKVLEGEMEQLILQLLALSTIMVTLISTETDLRIIFTALKKLYQKFQQLAKDAQSNGDPVLAQNYLQHADHYLRRYNELNNRKDNFNEKSKTLENPKHRIKFN